VLENSRIIEVITRDANNSGRIICRETLIYVADYNIDPISRSLYLKAPIASQDIEGNPIYLRVTVEIDKEGAYFRVRFKFDEDLFKGNDPSTDKCFANEPQL
jgi:hypothetical protein